MKTFVYLLFGISLATNVGLAVLYNDASQQGEVTEVKNETKKAIEPLGEKKSSEDNYQNLFADPEHDFATYNDVMKIVVPRMCKTLIESDKQLYRNSIQCLLQDATEPTMENVYKILIEDFEMRDALAETTKKAVESGNKKKANN